MCALCTRLKGATNYVEAIEVVDRTDDTVTVQVRCHGQYEAQQITDMFGCLGDEDLTLAIEAYHTAFAEESDAIRP